MKIKNILSTNTLKSLVNALKINKKDRDLLISKISELDEEERIKLLKVLSEIYFLDLEEKEVLENLRKNLKTKSKK